VDQARLGNRDPAVSVWHALAQQAGQFGPLPRIQADDSAVDPDGGYSRG
jgi:hypothetical protein